MMGKVTIMICSLLACGDSFGAIAGTLELWSMEQQAKSRFASQVTTSTFDLPPDRISETYTELYL